MSVFTSEPGDQTPDDVLPNAQRYQREPSARCCHITGPLRDALSDRAGGPAAPSVDVGHAPERQG